MSKGKLKAAVKEALDNAGLKAVDLNPEADQIPTINIDMDLKCKWCGQAGVGKNGLCLGCIAKSLTDDPDPQQLYPVPLGSSFLLPGEDPENDDAIEVDFLYTEELRNMGRELLDSQPTFSHLERARIDFLWKRQGGKKSGQMKLGQCQRPTGLLSYYSTLDFVIWCAADHCNSLLFTYHQVEALLFHELKHAGIVTNEETGETTWTIDGHDWEGFADEIRLYGDWRPDITNIRDAFQLYLFPMKAEAKGKK